MASAGMQDLSCLSVSAIVMLAVVPHYLMGFSERIVASGIYSPVCTSKCQYLGVLAAFQCTWL